LLFPEVGRSPPRHNPLTPWAAAGCQGRRSRRREALTARPSSRGTAVVRGGEPRGCEGEKPAREHVSLRSGWGARDGETATVSSASMWSCQQLRARMENARGQANPEDGLCRGHGGNRLLAFARSNRSCHPSILLRAGSRRERFSSQLGSEVPWQGPITRLRGENGTWCRFSTLPR